MFRIQKNYHRGNGIVEYILVTTLVTLASIAVFKAFREDLKKAYKKAGEALVQGLEDTSTSTPSNG